MTSEDAGEGAPVQNGLPLGHQKRESNAAPRTERPPVQAFDPHFPSPSADAKSRAEPRAYSPFRIYEPRETGY
jgi:hypothetical protein